MRWFSRSSPAAERVALGPPRLDGSGWPDESLTGRRTFAGATLHETALRHAHEPDAHAVADNLVAAARPRVGVAPASAEDEPHLRKVFTVAARIGAGIAAAEGGSGPAADGTVDRRTAAALWQARRGLPAMPPEQERAAAWFVLAGYLLAKRGVAGLPALLAELDPPPV